MTAVKHVLVELSDQAWQRTRDRIEGLTDEEYLWEPAPGCWTIRPGPDGEWKADWPLPRPDPEPFTTIAWRLWHLIDMYGENRAPNWLGVPRQGEAVGFEGGEGVPSAAADAIAMLERAHTRWDAHLALASDESLAENVGPVGGAYADRARAGYVLHMLDEFIHHGAEISLLRDLWRWQHPVDADPVVERVMRGDLGVIEDIDPSSGNHLVGVAAGYGRWNLVSALVRAGVRFDPETPGARTALHSAAGAGELEVVKLLVDHGADASAKDSEFHATPATWARFLSHDTVADWLDSQTAT